MIKFTKDEIDAYEDGYEEGEMQGFVFTNIRRRWWNLWQFWKPKKVYGNIGTYTKIGKVVEMSFYFRLGSFVTTKFDDISGLPIEIQKEPLYFNEK